MSAGLVLEVLKENPLHASLPAPGVFVQSLPSWGCSNITSISASVFTSPSSLSLCLSFLVSYKDALLGFRVYTNLIQSHLNPYLNYICKDPISKQGHILRFQVGLGAALQVGRRQSRFQGGSSLLHCFLPIRRARRYSLVKPND